MKKGVIGTGRFHFCAEQNRRVSKVTTNSNSRPKKSDN